MPNAAHDRWTDGRMAAVPSEPGGDQRHLAHDFENVIPAQAVVLTKLSTEKANVPVA